ncbi:MAG: hypothetical protein AAB588_05295 [Patescibacteria group bacterium]
MSNTSRPAFIKGLLWFTFSGTAMLSAFILPAHIWALSSKDSIMYLMESFLFRAYFFILILCALYHGLYRTKTILFDVGITKYQKSIGITLMLLFFVFMLLATVYLFILAPEILASQKITPPPALLL